MNNRRWKQINATSLGSGYPQGLKGESILQEARSIGLADVVLAMCSHRP